MNEPCGSNHRRRRRLGAGTLVAAALVLSADPAGAAQAATPQRPSLSFGSETVPGGGFELEAGASFAEGFGALPIFLKYGLTGRVELELGFDAIREVDADNGSITSAGDLLFGARARLPGPGRADAAVAGWVKAPTARDGAGSGEYDAGAVGIISLPAGRLGLDLNLWLSGLGQESGGDLGQVMGVVTLGVPAPGGWSAFAEVAFQRTATQGSGGFFDAGIAFAATPWAVFDAAAGAGWNEGFPDWAATAGWTLLLHGDR